MSNQTQITISNETKRYIFNDLVEDAYKRDVRETINNKRYWNITAITFETISKITVAIGGIMSFSSGYFHSNLLSFASGSVSVISLALLQFSVFSYAQYKKRSADLNILLEKIDLQPMPSLTSSIIDLGAGNERKPEFLGEEKKHEPNNELDHHSV